MTPARRAVPVPPSEAGPLSPRARLARGLAALRRLLLDPLGPDGRLAARLVPLLLTIATAGLAHEGPLTFVGPDGSGRYPTWASVQGQIERTYGSPASILEFTEEASWRADPCGGCFDGRDRPASLEAEAVVIVRLDR